MSGCYPRFGVAETAVRLRDSHATIEWALDILPGDWSNKLPAYYPADSWTATHNLGHLILYEERIGLPILSALVEGADAKDAHWSMLEDDIVKDAQALAAEPAATLRHRLSAARKQSIALVESFSDGRFNDRVAPLWNTGIHGTPPHSPGWVANKTFQHTWEHGNAILRLALFSPTP